MNNAQPDPELAVNSAPITASSRLSIRLRASRGARRLGILFAACLTGLPPLPAQAVLLTISETPLFLQNAVQPNIFFMLDDSGSMDWETVYNPGTNCNSANGTSALDFTPDTSGSLSGCPSSYTIVQVERLRLCVGFNTLAYSPTVTYTPWYGKDSAGVDYKNAWLYGTGTDASPNFTVRQNPYLASGTTLNLNSAGTVAYRLWTDSNGNGDYDDGECGDKNSATSQTWYFACPSGGCPLGTSVLTVDEKKNFANWYMYYRKREYVMKRAVSDIIKNSRARLGLSTLWRNSLSGSVGIRIENVDDITQPVNATAAANKTTLLSHLSRIDSANGTPLRNALDNVGKYFEGVSQTALFGSTPGHTGTVNSNSPILSSTTGGSCQQNFVLMMTDGYYNSGYSGTNVGNADGDASSAFDVPNATKDPNATSQQYADTQSNTLGDIAMYYYERDLHPSLPNKVGYTSGIDIKTPGAVTPGDGANDDVVLDVNGVPDPAKSGVLMHQHMVTYTVAFGLSGNLDPEIQGVTPRTASACDTDPAAACWGNSPNTYSPSGWPNQTPATMEDTNAAVDDLWHAAYNGRGKFLSGRNPTKLTEALNSAMADIFGRTGTSSSVAASASSASTSSRLYVPQFTSGEWSGALIALKFVEDINGNITGLADTDDWGSPKSDAGEILKTQNWDTGRNILTRNGTTGVAFRWTNLSASQQSALNTNPVTATNDGNGSQRLEFLRGDHSREKPSGSYRQRTNSYVLGDTVNSAAVFVGPPSSFFPDSVEPTAAWSAFRGTYVNRTPMIYLGANDGMLHGFAACKSATDPAGCTASDRGREKIAYVPSRVFGKLNQLTDPAYTHRFYVDGTPTISDAFYGGAWHTMLVGGLRAGGQGIYALDVTNPSSFNEANANSIVKWEFTDANDADLGYTFSQPVIVKSNFNNKWVAIFGNGYNNSEADGAASTTGLGALFIVDIADGTLIRKITVPVGSVATPNGLATPRLVDINNDFKADIAYAGDLQGNLWKFDLRNSDKDAWTVAKLFTALDPSNNPQPITSKPELTFHPAGQTGFMLFFGTGKYLEGGATDTASTQTQSFYGIWDSQGSAGGATLVAGSSLRTQTLSQTLVGVFPARTITNNVISAWGTGAGQFMGWKVDFSLSTGERVIANPQYLSDGRLLFVSNIPDTDPCNYGGTSWEYQLNIANGGPPGFTVFDVNNDGSFNSADNAGSNVVVGVQLGGIAPQPLVLDTDKGRVIVTPSTMTTDPKDSTMGKTDKDPSLGRQSWRQLQ